MKKIGSAVFASAIALSGCAGMEDTAPEIECYPGDKDCNDGSGGKAEGWNSSNNPRHLSQNFNYRLDELPLKGEAENKPWAASYWPTVEGSTNYRWQGEDTLSPMEKYDAAFHDWTPSEAYATSVPEDCGPDAKTDYKAYVDTLGPAAKWQSSAQSRSLLFNGVNDDSDDDQDVDECYEVLEEWWGLCHAWAPAAILEPEPLKAVEYNGQRFEVSDIKALILTAYDDTESLMLGGRCNAKEIEHDDRGRAKDIACRDTNAGAFHVVTTNFLGINKQGFVEDRDGGFEVWNQPVYSYDVTMLEEIDVARANDLLGVEGDEYTFNDKAEKLFEVKTTLTWLTEGHQSTRPLGTDGYLRNDYYHYILEIDANGKIAGGEWVGDSKDNHPDFLWSPVKARTSSWRRSNPNVDLDQVHMLIEMSRSDEPTPTGGNSYRNDTPVAIPDNSAAGASTTVSVTDDFTVRGLSVGVNIDHTYIGDLQVVLEKGGNTVVLHDNEGGGASGLVKTYQVSDFDGQAAQGDWTVRVVDSAAVDTGTINSVTLTFAAE